MNSKIALFKHCNGYDSSFECSILTAEHRENDAHKQNQHTGIVDTVRKYIYSENAETQEGYRVQRDKLSRALEPNIKNIKGAQSQLKASLVDRIKRINVKQERIEKGMDLVKDEQQDIKTMMERVLVNSNHQK